MAGSWDQFFKSIMETLQSGTRLEEVIDDARKTLGKSAKVPEPTFDIHKIADEVRGANDELSMHMSELKKMILEGKNTFSQAINDLENYRQSIMNSDFEMATQDKGEGKKIAEVRKVFQAYFSDKLSNMKTGLTVLNRLSAELDL